MHSNTESKVQDRILQIMKLMVMHGENRFCFECHQLGPSYVDMTIGSFVCTGCGGALRKYSHRIKSFSVSNFSLTEIEFLRKRGNKACRKIYLARIKETEKQLVDEKLDDYLRMKYQLKKWYSEPTSEIETEAIADNQAIMDQAEIAENQKTFAIPGINATKGLIIAPPSKPLAKQNSSTSVTAKSTQSNNTSGSTTDNNGFNKSQAQSTTPKPPCDLFNGFGDYMFHPTKNATSGPEAPFDPFDEFCEQSAPAQNNQEQDFFSSLIPPQPTPNTLSFASTTTNTVSGGPVIFSLQTGSPVGNIRTTNSMFPTVTTASQDKYAALAELDNMLKMKTSPGFSGTSAFSSSATTAAAGTVSNTLAPKWSPLTAVTPSQPMFNFPTSGTVSSVGKPANPFASIAGVPDGSVKHFQPNFATTLPQNTSAAMPFTLPTTTNGLSTAGGPVNSHNPFMSTSAGAPTVRNPFTTAYDVNNSLGKPGSVAGSTPNTFTAFQQPTAVNQQWPTAFGSTLNQPFSLPFGPNNTQSGSLWPNGTPKTGNAFKF